MKIYHSEASMQGHLKNRESVSIKMESFHPSECKNEFIISISHVDGETYKYMIDELLEKLGLDFQPEPEATKES